MIATPFSMASILPKPRSEAVRITGRVLLAVIGGYFTASGIVAALSVVLVTMGMAASESGMLTVMLGVAIYLVMLIWGFASRRLAATALIWMAMTAIAFGIAALSERS